MTPRPVGADAERRLQAVAAWDVPALRSGLRALTDLDDRFPSWRTRLDVVVRTLDDGGSWSGPAATQAYELLLQLSRAAAALDAGLADSRAELAAVTREAATATERAATALALAAQLPGPLGIALAEADAPGALVDRLVLEPRATHPAVAAAQEAFAAADAARGAAGRAVDALPAGVPFLVTGAARFPAAGVGSRLAPPAEEDPAAVARWWAALPAGAQLDLVAASPATVGSLDGVPAWARDRANRELLRQAIEDPRADDGRQATARVVAAVLATPEAVRRGAQLHLLDLAGDRVVVAFGDLDAAESVAVVVPGIRTAPADDLAGVSGNAQALAAAARRAEPGLAVAVVAWLGYRTPHTPRSVLTRRTGERGGVALDAGLDGLAAARDSAGVPRPRTTVVGHSYGTVVLDEAADRPGPLAADAVVLLGSPGMEDDAGALEAPEVYDAASPADPVSWAGWFGTVTWAPRFGSTGLPTELSTGHSDYFDRDRPTLAAMGEVVAGRRGD